MLLNTDNITYGLDIGGTKIEIGIFSQLLNEPTNLHLLNRNRLVTPTKDYKSFIDVLVHAIQHADEIAGCKGDIGIGMPGILDKNGQVISANIPCATGHNVQQDLQERLGRKVSAGNDCRLFALSESHGGSGDGFKRVYGAIVGTGAAGGFCIDGELYHGRRGVAGEYGHLPVSAHLIQKHHLPIFTCGCGLKGCYESYVAGPGLGRLYKHFGAANPDTYHFIEQLRNNDPVAKVTFDCYMELLGASFASIVVSYDPDIIVIGGGMSKINEVVTALPTFLNTHLFAGVECPPIVKAKFGDASGVRGAAILGSQHAKT
jgi:N-acetylglucosamine kinase